MGAGRDTAPAWSWLAALTDVAAKRLALDAASLDDYDVIWVHASAEPPPLPRERVMGWVATGGRLLLTQRATIRVAALGLERDGPNDCTTRVWRHAEDEWWLPQFRAFAAFPHIRGLGAFGPHPLFAGMGQGTYVWAPSEGEPDVRAVYARCRRPANGHVVACERSYIHLNADRIVAWEYPVGAGGVLCVGAFVALGAPDRLLERHLRAVLANALLGEGIPSALRTGQARHWPPPPPPPGSPRQVLVVPDAPPLDGAFPDFDSPLHTTTHPDSDEPFTLAGRRLLVVGGERSGVREIWAHPWRILQDLHLEVGGETALVRDVEVMPGAVRRHLLGRQRVLSETVTTALDLAVALIEYRQERTGRARNVRAAPAITLRWAVDLRRMWPYPPADRRDVTYAVSPDARSLAVARPGYGGAVTVHASRPVEWRVHPDRRTAALRCELSAVLDEPLRLAVAGDASPDGAAAAVGRRGVTALTGQRRRHEQRLRDSLVRVVSPDDQFDRAFEWAKVRLDGFFIETPELGRSLAAGYAASRPGWGDGRPGYAWFFGRDACWTAFALLAAGDFSGARLVLRFLGRTQDVRGKVIHELTTSGLAHYDAADSTPLYLLLAGRLAQWTGDLEFLAERWLEIERAYRFCLETDTDGDGLIENTRVGHGWLEMGPLAGAHVTLYLAAIWTAALDSLGPVARALGRGALADELAERAGRARQETGRRFLTGDGYAPGILADGTPLRHRTALTAVPLLLEAVDSGPAAGWLDAMTSDAFTAPWGVRLVARGHPFYNPGGYHTGAVWPLYTGWVSLAEFACHRAEAAFAHLAVNARLPFAREQGAFDEVLHGEEERAAGVCSNQAWSAAMLVSPAVEGLLGARPNALDGHLRLVPHLPVAWPQAEWRGLRVGHSSVDVRIARAGDRLVLALRRTSGRRLGVAVAPALPPGRVVAEARVDGAPVAPREWERDGCRHAEVAFDLVGEHAVELQLGARG